MYVSCMCVCVCVYVCVLKLVSIMLTQKIAITFISNIVYIAFWITKFIIRFFFLKVFLLPLFISSFLPQFNRCHLTHFTSRSTCAFRGTCTLFNRGRGLVQCFLHNRACARTTCETKILLFFAAN